MGVDTPFSSSFRAFSAIRIYTEGDGHPRRAVTEKDPLLDHTGNEKDAEDGNKDSDNLMEAVHPFTPEDLRAGDQQPVDDELALRGSGDEHEETDCCNQASPKNVHGPPPAKKHIRSETERRFGAWGRM
jgi:hypothetical protein